MLRVFLSNRKTVPLHVSLFSTAQNPITQTKPKDYYSILQVKPTASHSEIKAAYLQLSKKFHPDACNEDASRFIDIAEAFSVLGNNETRQQYDAKRKLMAFGLFGDGFKMHYPAPHSDLSEEVLNAYNDEMRRRWHNRLEEWARGQAAYELERGITMDPLTTILPPSSHSRLSDNETRWYMTMAGIFCVFTAGYAYYVLHA